MSDARRRHGLPEPLAGEVRAELARLGGVPAAGDMPELTAAWPQAVGPAIVANAWPARFARDGTLIVHASSSTWAFELGHLADTIRERLGALAPERLRFVVGPVPAAAAETVSSPHRVVHRASPAERAQGDEIAREIEAPALREAVARAAAASLAAASRRVGPTGASDRLADR